MASIDPTVAAVLDKSSRAKDSDDEDELIATLEEDDDNALTALREQRLQQLHSEYSRAKKMADQGAGTYAEVKDEKEVMDITTSTKLVVVHFFKSDFGRCGVMDRHLEILATKHFDTRFIKINVDNAPFLVTKLKVQVLPCVIAFVDGISIDRIIGFEGLGHGDSFTTRDLETRLLRSGILVRAKTTAADMPSAQNNAKKGNDEDVDDDEWD